MVAVYRLTQTSKLYRNSYHICGTTVRVHYLPSQALHLITAKLLVGFHFFYRTDFVLNHCTDYTERLQAITSPLRVLVEDELSRLTVWRNPANEATRGADHLWTAVTEVRNQ